MLKKTIKRFYKQVGIAAAGNGFAIHLDGRPVKTPAGTPLTVRSRLLAEAMAAEWDAQTTDIKPATMPLTQLASTALDRIGPERPVILEQMAKFAGTDLLCYRAAYPPDLVARQTRLWQPLLEWAAEVVGAVLATTTEIIAIEQSPEALAALTARLDGYDVWRLTAAQAACAASGSLVLALAFAEGRLTGQDTFDLSQLDETFQIEQWGEDYEAADRRAELKGDILAAEQFLRLA